MYLTRVSLTGMLAFVMPEGLKTVPAGLMAKDIYCMYREFNDEL